MGCNRWIDGSKNYDKDLEADFGSHIDRFAILAVIRGRHHTIIFACIANTRRQIDLAADREAAADIELIFAS